MAVPPLLAGAVNAKLMLPLPGVATSAVGAPGTVLGVGVGVGVGVADEPPPQAAKPAAKPMSNTTRQSTMAQYS
jgi:hypothetical protein